MDEPVQGLAPLVVGEVKKLSETFTIEGLPSFWWSIIFILLLALDIRFTYWRMVKLFGG
jgi:hypothetical protein